ncbi:hypothetical protein [[Mycoplasma] gypis]|nr:hypothetical protein [[Mycoplasma] gypis]MBN0919364.1 hypothetical protein [[Mycoplasma] gypis]
MDFPGIGLVQEIIRTNFYISDYQVQKGLLGPIVNDIKVSNLYDFDNVINFNQNLNNWYLDIYIDNKKISTQTIKNSSFTTLKSQKFLFNQKVKLEFYKMTPANNYYQSRKYNVITKQLVVQHDRNYINNLNDLKQKLENLKKQINNTSYLSGDITTFIDQKLLKKINILITNGVKTEANVNEYNKIKKFYDSQSSSLIDFQNNLSKFELQKSIFNQENLVFEEQNVKKFLQKNEILAERFKRILSNEELESIDLEAFQKISETQKNILDLISTNIQKFILNNHEFNELISSLFFGYEKLADFDSIFKAKKQDYILASNSVLTQHSVHDIENILTQVQKQKAEIQATIEFAINFLKQINQLYREADILQTQNNYFFLNLNKILNSQDLQQGKLFIANFSKLISLNEEIKQILKQNSDYLNQNAVFNDYAILSEYKNIIQQLQEATQTNTQNGTSFDFLNSLIRKIKELKQDINLIKINKSLLSKDWNFNDLINPIFYGNQNLSKYIEKLNLLKQEFQNKVKKIKTLTQNNEISTSIQWLTTQQILIDNDVNLANTFIQKINSHFKNSDILETQKEYLYAQVSSLLISKNTNQQQNFIDRFSQLTLLNSKLKEAIKQSEKINSKFYGEKDFVGQNVKLTKYQEIKKYNELITEIKNILTQDSKSAINLDILTDLYNKVQEAKTAVIELNVFLVQLNSKMKTVSNLAIFQINEVQNLIKDSNSLENLKQAQNTLESLIAEDAINNRIKTFDSFSTTQKQETLKKLLNSATEEEYQKNKATFKKFNIKNKEANTILSNTNIFVSSLYLNSNENIKNNFKNSYDELKEFVVSESLDLNQLKSVIKKYQMYYQQLDGDNELRENKEQLLSEVNKFHNLSELNLEYSQIINSLESIEKLNSLKSPIAQIVKINNEINFLLEGSVIAPELKKQIIEKLKQASSYEKLVQIREEINENMSFEECKEQLINIIKNNDQIFNWYKEEQLQQLNNINNKDKLKEFNDLYFNNYPRFTVNNSLEPLKALSQHQKQLLTTKLKEVQKTSYEDLIQKMKVLNQNMLQVKNLVNDFEQLKISQNFQDADLSIQTQVSDILEELKSFNLDDNDLLSKEIQKYNNAVTSLNGIEKLQNQKQKAVELIDNELDFVHAKTFKQQILESRNIEQIIEQNNRIQEFIKVAKPIYKRIHSLPENQKAQLLEQYNNAFTLEQLNQINFPVVDNSAQSPSRPTSPSSPSTPTNEKNPTKKVNKSLIVALAVILPIVAIAIAAGVFIFKKFKK